MINDPATIGHLSHRASDWDQSGCPTHSSPAERIPPAALPTRPLLAMTGEDGNAVAILARAKRAAFKAGWGIDQITAMVDEATSGDYDHLVATMTRRFETC